MKKIKMTIGDIQKVKELCSIANMNEGDVTVQRGRFIVDAKSIMGLFSLDLSNEVEVTFYEPITVDVDEVL